MRSFVLAPLLLATAALASSSAPATTFSTMTLASSASASAAQASSTGGVSTECVGGSYDSCFGDVMCVQSWPKSCECANSAKVRCASACGVETPQQEDCSSTKPRL